VVTRTGKAINAFGILVGKPFGKRQFGRLRRNREMGLGRKANGTGLGSCRVSGYGISCYDNVS
jgi:hypothetical protein